MQPSTEPGSRLRKGPASFGPGPMRQEPQAERGLAGCTCCIGTRATCACRNQPETMTHGTSAADSISRHRHSAGSLQGFEPESRSAAAFEDSGRPAHRALTNAFEASENKAYPSTNGAPVTIHGMKSQLATRHWLMWSTARDRLSLQGRPPGRFPEIPCGEETGPG